jgi:hypothetical protein
MNQYQILNNKLPENLLPDCVYITLDKLSQQVQPSAEVTTTNIVIKLTIRFGKQEFETPIGLIVFGLKRCELKLSLKNGIMPISKMGLTAPFLKIITNEIGRKEERNMEVDIGKTCGVRSEIGREESSKTYYKYSQIYTRGTEIEPVWVFEAQVQECLLGQIAEEQLGTVEIISQPCDIDAKLTVRSQHDVYLKIKELSPEHKKLRRNQEAIYLRAFYLEYIKSQIQPHISRDKVLL